MPSSTFNHCPCGSQHHYAACCGQYIDNNISAPTAETLMRSRYSAYTRSHSDYLLKSWYPATRPTTLDLTQPPIAEWLGLNICRIEAGSERDSHGVVEFIARYKAEGKTAVIHEISRFTKEEQRWYYVDGTISQSAQNSPCPCGSNKKFKRCCGK